MRQIRALTSNSNELIRIAGIGAIWIGLHLYAARPLLVAAAAGGIAPLVAWTAVLLMPFVSMLPLLARRDGAWKLRSFAHWTGYASMSFFSILLMLVLTSDIARLMLLFVRATLSARTVSFLMLISAAILAFVGLLQARRPRVVRVPITIANLPADLDGYRIVQWSDVHVGPTIQRRFVESLVERTNELRADAIVITGDLIDGHVDDLRQAVEPLRDLRAPDGVFVVTGNHEYYWRASEWVKEFARLGLTFLKNEHRLIRRGDASLVMAGVTDPVGRDTHQTNPTAALAGAPADATRVLLAHRPQTAQAASRLGVHLQLSGHTHGGQFFPFNLMIRWFQPVVSGLHRIGNTLLYVSRGTGYWGPPSRLGVGGEITMIELRRRTDGQTD
jgi:predicted MPP superfamily phosphohydrolase